MARATLSRLFLASMIKLLSTSLYGMAPSRHHARINGLWPRRDARYPKYGDIIAVKPPSSAYSPLLIRLRGRLVMLRKRLIINCQPEEENCHRRQWHYDIGDACDNEARAAGALRRNH